MNTYHIKIAKLSTKVFSIWIPCYWSKLAFLFAICLAVSIPTNSAYAQSKSDDLVTYNFEGKQQTIEDILGVGVDYYNQYEDLMLARVKSEFSPSEGTYVRFKDDRLAVHISRRHFLSILLDCESAKEAAEFQNLLNPDDSARSSFTYEPKTHGSFKQDVKKPFEIETWRFSAVTLSYCDDPEAVHKTTESLKKYVSFKMRGASDHRNLVMSYGSLRDMLLNCDRTLGSYKTYKSMGRKDDLYDFNGHPTEPSMMEKANLLCGHQKALNTIYDQLDISYTLPE